MIVIKKKENATKMEQITVATVQSNCHDHCHEHCHEH